MTWAGLDSNPDWVAPDPLYAVDGSGEIVVSGEDRTASEVLRYAEFERTLLIDTILKLIIKMIESLQEVTAAVSERLSFLSQWQAAYTDQMDQIVAFSGGAPTPEAAIGSNNSTARNARDDLNRVNATYTEQLRSRQSIVSDTADALQTTVNQLSDAVSQQTDLATSLLQQLSTILSSIYK
jgi:hypothetical protein